MNKREELSNLEEFSSTDCAVVKCLYRNQSADQPLCSDSFTWAKHEGDELLTSSNPALFLSFYLTGSYLLIHYSPLNTSGLKS